MIYHILPQSVFDGLDDSLPYRAATLAEEGFMHCTGEPEMLVRVANRFYRETTGPFVLLCIEEERVAPVVRWEAADGHLFPHIYGPLNWDAVERVIDFPRNAAGEFLLPSGLP